MDPIIGGAAIGAGSGLIGGLINAGVQSSTNKQNERLTREAWAREDNAVQRRAKDMKAAGLNPILAAGQGAASSQAIPAGSSTPGTDMAHGGTAGAQAGANWYASKIAKHDYEIIKDSGFTSSQINSPIGQFITAGKAFLDQWAKTSAERDQVGQGILDFLNSMRGSPDTPADQVRALTPSSTGTPTPVVPPPSPYVFMNDGTIVPLENKSVPTPTRDTPPARIDSARRDSMVDQITRLGYPRAQVERIYNSLKAGNSRYNPSKTDILNAILAERERGRR